MPIRTLTELRALARTRGLKGYTQLSPGELEKRLSADGGKKSAAPKKAIKTAPKKVAPKKFSAKANPKPGPPPAKPARPPGKKKLTAPATRSTAHAAAAPAL